MGRAVQRQKAQTSPITITLSYCESWFLLWLGEQDPRWCLSPLVILCVLKVGPLKSFSFSLSLLSIFFKVDPTVWEKQGHLVTLAPWPHTTAAQLVTKAGLPGAPQGPAMPDALTIRVMSPERGHEQLSSVFVETVMAIHCGHANPTCVLLHWNWNVNAGKVR